MNFVNYFSAIIIPFIIAFTLFYGIVEKKNVYDIFLKGVKNGFKIVIKNFRARNARRDIVNEILLINEQKN